MRGAVRRIEHEAEEESAFVSMTDLTVSFLFIVMILLAFFASQYSDEDVVPARQYEAVVLERDDTIRTLDTRTLERDDALRSLDEAQERLAELERQLAELRRPDPLETYIARASATRLKILEELRSRLQIDFPSLKIQISQESDALRFQGEGLFRTGEGALRPRPRETVEAVARRLEEILPCYTLGTRSRWGEDCNAAKAIIEAVQIEGHTDSTGNPMANLDLSTRRANSTFSAMLESEPTLTAHLNYRNQPVMSVSGYGQMRPVASNDTDVGRSTNRRIDLRLIMYTPSRSEELSKIAERLGARPERGGSDG